MSKNDNPILAKCLKRKIAIPPLASWVGAHLWADEASLVSFWPRFAFIGRRPQPLPLFVTGLEPPRGGRCRPRVGSKLHLSPCLHSSPSSYPLLQLTHSLKDAKTLQNKSLLEKRFNVVQYGF